MITRSLAGILLVLMLAIAGTPCVASATDIDKTDTTALSIPDDGSQVWSNINVSYSDIVNSGISNPANAAVTGIDVSFTSNHQRSQDLEIYLQYSSYGTVNSNYYLWNHEGGTAPNPTKTVNGISHFNGLSPNGNWTLYVKDTSPGATGNITSWQIKVYYTSASGPGTTAGVNASFLDNLTYGHDENNDGYMEDYQFLIALDIAAPTNPDVKVYSKIICNTTGQSWTGGEFINNDHNVQIWNQSYLQSHITQNSTLNFTVELWDDNTYSHFLLDSAPVTGNPIKVGVGYFPYGLTYNWVPDSDIDADGYYDSYQFELYAEGRTFAGPKNVYAKIICTTTGQFWWASEPWNISDVENDYHLFNFTQADFAGYIVNDTTLNFIVELWDTTKTTKLGSTANINQIDYSYTGPLKVESSPCSVSVNNFTATNSTINPSTGESTTLTASIAATPPATWRLNINNEDIASSNTSSVSKTWYGKNLAGTILDPGTYTATLTATDASTHCTASNSIPLTVVHTYPALQITTTSLPPGYIGSPYSQTLAATGGNENYFWSKISGDLPAGLTLHPNGVIDGNPTASGSFTVQVSDSQSPAPATAIMPLTVDIYSNLTISTTSIVNGSFGTAYSQPFTATGGHGSFGTAYSQPFTATGGHGSYTWSVSSGSLPDGLEINASTGLISGTPADIGNFPITIQVNDAINSPPASLPVTLIITNGLMQHCIESSTAAVGDEASTKICTRSTTDIISGVVDHDQELFSTKGGMQNIAISLFYKSLPAYNGSLGIGWSHSYDISLTLNADGSIVLKKGNGDKKYYTKNGSVYVSPPGDFSTLEVSGSDYVIKYRDGSSYNFNNTGKITSIADRFGNTLAFDYTGGNLTITDSAWRTATIVYDQATTPPRITTITDPAGKVYNFSYQGSKLYRVTNPAATTGAERGYWEYEYHPNGLLKSKRDPNGHKSQYTYYADKRMQTAIDPDGISNPIGHTRTVTYPTTTDNIRTTTLTEKDGNPWYYTYDAQAGVIKYKTDPNGKIINFYYYPNGFIKAKTEPKDGAVRLTTFFTYDSYGNILTETEPSDISTTDPENVTDPTTLGLKVARHYTYDYDITQGHYDRIKSVIDERGTTTLATGFTYGTENNGDVITATSTPGNYVTVTRKNPNGSVKEIISANTASNHTSFTYYPDTTDSRTAGIVGLLKTITDPANIVTTINSFDNNGNPTNVTITDKDGVVVPVSTIMIYDNLSRLTTITKHSTKTVPYFTDIVTSYRYDLDGNVTSVIDAEQHETKYEFNYNRQVTKTTDAKLNDTIFKYSGSEQNGVDKLVGVYDANVAKKTPLESQPHTAYLYDQLGRLDTETDPLGKKIHFTYYDNGLVKEKYDATNSIPGTLLVTYTYNNRGQITDKTFTDDAYEHYTYTANGQLETAGNQNISYTYAYYTDGRLQSVTDNSTPTNRKISYDQYDALGQRKQVTIFKDAGTDQRIITYDYDSANRPWHITSTAGQFTYGYDTSGRRQTVTYPNQLTANYVFDDLNRLTSITHKDGATPFASFNYTQFDTVGNRKTVNGSRNESYVYDELYRLLSVVSPKPETFTFDAVGNRESGPNVANSAYQHNAANQMTQGLRLGYGYDNAGNQTTKTVSGAIDKTWTRTWDYNNRVIKEEKVKGTEKRTVTYKYDPFGRRIEKTFVETVDVDGIPTTETETTTYVYDNEDIVLEIWQTDTGTEKTFFTHGPGIDEPLALERSGSFYYYHADGLGSITAITDANHSTVQTYEYEAYGLPTQSTDFRNSYQFTAREYDWETGLQYARERYRDLMDGDFISKDPIGFAGGINLYQAVGSNPVNFVDPYGLDKIANGLIYNDDGDIIGEVGLESPNPFFDPINYIGGLAGVASKAIRGAIAKQGTQCASNEATGFLGSKRLQLQNAQSQPVRNTPSSIGGRDYSAHALDQMQNRGVMPSVVENAIQNGVSSAGKYAGSIQHLDTINNLRVIVNSATGRIITVIRGVK